MTRVIASSWMLCPMQNDPVIHLWVPDKVQDVPWLRHIQHVYFFPVTSALYVMWRKASIQQLFQSVRHTLRNIVVVVPTQLYLSRERTHSFHSHFLEYHIAAISLS